MTNGVYCRFFCVFFREDFTRKSVRREGKSECKVSDCFFPPFLGLFLLERALAFVGKLWRSFDFDPPPTFL